MGPTWKIILRRRGRSADPPAPGRYPPRRLRRTATLRRMVCETVLAADDFIYPPFITAESGVVRSIAAMSGHAQWFVDRLAAEIE